MLFSIISILSLSSSYHPFESNPFSLRYYIDQNRNIILSHGRDENPHDDDMSNGFMDDEPLHIDGFEAEMGRERGEDYGGLEVSFPKSIYLDSTTGTGRVETR